MKFSSDRKQTILTYLLEKINAGTENPAEAVAGTFEISRNTVNTYLRELLNDGIITKEKRGRYSLVSERTQYRFRRSAGEMRSETEIFDICMKDRLGQMPVNVQHIWSYALSGMINNVIDHSEAEHLLIELRENCLSFSVTITDDGVGIFEKIKTYFSLDSLDDAICELFKGKLTTDRRNHSGEGIFFSSKMMDSFVISSGGKQFSVDPFDGTETKNSAGTDDLTGTSVSMSLSKRSNKNAAEIFNCYSDTDGGFNKTIVPLKNIFDGVPVSRSQAKRVCCRLEEFSEVILDFRNVSWMGQGFAHQIFVVFAGAHPEITLSPVNMSESVAEMHRHVLSGS